MEWSEVLRSNASVECLSLLSLNLRSTTFQIPASGFEAQLAVARYQVTAKASSLLETRFSKRVFLLGQ